MRKLLKIVAALAVAYGLVVGGLAWAMNQPPEQFGQIMSRMPRVAFLVLPFRALWLQARAGSLSVGDAAPDFRLQTYDRKGWVQLSSFRGEKPVVLVFGSYT